MASSSAFIFGAAKPCAFATAFSNRPTIQALTDWPSAENPYSALMRQFIVPSGEVITATGIYRMVDHPQREITLINGDLVPTFQGKKVKFRLIRAAKNPRRG